MVKKHVVENDFVGNFIVRAVGAYVEIEQDGHIMAVWGEDGLKIVNAMAKGNYGIAEMYLVSGGDEHKCMWLPKSQALLNGRKVDIAAVQERCSMI